MRCCLRTWFCKIKQKEFTKLGKLFSTYGWARWIRTIGMTESKSAALPLGYTPIQNYIIEGPDRSPTKWIRFGKEEGVSVVQFSPRGGNGTVLTSSDVVVMPAGLEPGITSLRGLRPVRLDEGTIYGDPRRI